jgi:flagellar biogenesis protein FliO
MLRFILHAALVLSIALVDASFGAEPAESPGPPAWLDNHSVYLSVPQSRPAGSAATGQLTTVEQQVNKQPPAMTPTQTAERMDQAVVPALYSTQVQPESGADQRHLAPPSRSPSNTESPIAETNAHSTLRTNRGDIGVPLDAIYTVLSALAIVVGTFLACAWMLKRGARTTATVLPADVVSVLGRVPLAARQFAQLLRVGNKLVLVSLMPGGAKTLTEVTDPVEVDRIVGMCQQLNPHSTTKAFEQVFQQLSRESAPNGFLGSESILPPLSSALDKIRPPRGEAAHA